MDAIVAADFERKDLEDLQGSLRDAEIAYQLQLQEAVDASCNSANRSLRGGRKSRAQRTNVEADPSWNSLLYAAQLQFQENLRLCDAHIDREVAKDAFCSANRVANQIQHDKEFAQYVESVPEALWEREGDWIHDPWNARDDETSVTLTFAGYAQRNTGPAGCAGALLTPDGSKLWEGGKGLGLETPQRAKYHGLILAMEQAHALGLTNLRVKGVDDEIDLGELDPPDLNFLYWNGQEGQARGPIDLIAKISTLFQTFHTCTFTAEEPENRDRIHRLAWESASRRGNARGRATCGRGSAGDTRPVREMAPSSSAQGLRSHAAHLEKNTKRVHLQDPNFFRPDGKGPMHPHDQWTPPGQNWGLPPAHDRRPLLPQDYIFPRAPAGPFQAASSSPPEPYRQSYLIECMICLENVDEASLHTIDACSHAFCIECTEQHILHSIEARKIPVVCPHPDCSKNMSDTDCVNMLSSKDMAARFLELSAELSIPEKDRLYCPNPRCSTLLRVTQVAQNSPIECPGCHEVICVWCKTTWHAGFTCKQFNRMPREVRSPEEKSLMALAKKKRWRECKRCKRVIELSVGCNHITCLCGYEFCYVCGAEWSLKQDEDGELAGPACGCDMFTTPAEEHRAGARAQPQPQLPRRQPCRHWQSGRCRFGARCRFQHG